MKGNSGYLINLIKSSLEEFIILVFYSLLPIVIGALTFYLMSDSKDVGKSIDESIRNGELLLWSLTITSGIAYSLVRNPPVTYRLLFILYCLLLLICTTVYHALNLTLSEKIYVAADFSLWVALITMAILLFNIYLCKKDPPNTSEFYNKSASKFGEQYIRSRERG